MTLEDSIRSFLSAVREGIRQQQLAKAIIASGKSADSLVIQSTETSGTLSGSDYFYYQVHGRNPGEMPPIKSIEQWIQDKHLNLNAWAVAKTIAKKGTQALTDKSKALDLQSIVEDCKKDLISNITESFRDKIVLQIKI